MSKMKDWTELSGDVNWAEYGAKWCRKAADGAWWILRFENKAEWGDGAAGYYCEIHRINLPDVPASEIASALSSCGWEFEEGSGDIVAPYSGDVVAEFSSVHFELVLIDCLDGYGCYSPMGSEEGESYPLRVRAAARRAAEEMMGSYAATNIALNRTVNAIGSTAADFGRGDRLAGLRRKAHGVLVGAEPELSQADSIMLKMYGAVAGRTLGGKVEAVLAAAGKKLVTE